MNRNTTITYGSVAVLFVCAGILASNWFGSDEESAPKQIESTPDTSNVPVNAWSNFAVDKLEKVSSTGLELKNLQQVEDEPEEQGENFVMAPAEQQKFDAQNWENSGDNISQRIQSYISGRELPRAPEPFIARKVVNIKYKQDMYKEIRAKSLEDKDESAWVHIKYSPEVLGEDVTGLRIMDPEATDFLAMHDIEEGDLIKSINGNDLDSFSAVSQGINTMSMSDQLQLVIDRGGEIVNINIDKNTVKLENEDRK